ncbi:MAG TPA: DEAD/DEAH box helicase [Micropruina sp.]|nr:DEAD/DEAH box helicase [Micropruina sp.]HMR21470.1 DEAD/DEAH box helicase [Micropruina sp.]
MNAPKYPAWVNEASERSLAELFGVTTLSRGKTYADQGRVGSITSGSGAAGSVVQARVRGSSYRIYQTVVRHDAASGAVTTSCTCPVRDRCKHAAALVWHMRLVNQRALTPAWQRALAEVTADTTLQQGQGQPLALQVTRTAGDLQLRPLIWGRSGRWVRTGINWDNLQYQWGGQYQESHREPLAGLVRARDQRSTPSYYSRRVDELWLGELGASAWFWLRQALDAGVELVPGRDTPPLRVGEPARLVSHLTRTDTGVQLRTVAATGDLERAVPYANLLGDPPHGFAIEHEHELLLVPFAEPLSKGQQALLLQHARLEIPAAELPAFTAQFYPALRRLVALEVADDVDLPEAVPPRLRLAVGFLPDHVSTLAWTFRYRVGDADFDVELDPHGQQGVLRDPDAEQALLAALPEGPWPATTVGAVRRPVERATLSGPGTAQLAELGLPALRDAGVIVEVTGEAVDYRLATEAPQVTLTVADPAEGTDWFNLDVRVSIEGEPVEYRELFTALATGQTHLILPSGTWFGLDRPELEQLRTLIAEARELAPDGDPQLRLRAEHAGLWEELVTLGVVARQSAEWQRSVSALLDLDGLPEVPPPSGLEATLRPYQEHGFRWLHFLYTARLGGILADDMGLGKTMQVLALTCALKEAGELERPVLVVAPTSVLGTWAAEAARFAPGLDVRVVSQTAKKRNEPLVEVAAGADLVVTSYTLVRLDESDYVAQPWAAVVLDEAQFVKNRQARGHQSVRKLSARTKFAVTGTPLENNLMDLWSLLSIVAPGLFADPTRFAERYRKPIESGSDAGALARLHRRVRPLMLRRTKETVAAELPEKQEQVLSIELTPTHRRLYDKQLAVERKKVLGLVDDLQRNRIGILAALTTLRQLALSPALVLPGQAAVSAKIDALLEMVGELAAEGHRALVFSQFTGYLALVRQRLTDEGIGYSYLDGRTRDRAARIETFRAGNDPVFLISLKAGGFGLTLTEADYVFILDPWWNPAAELQAIDRTHRIGQDKPVMVYRMVSADTIEEKVVALQQRKRDLFAKVVGEAGDLAAPLTADDIRGLLEL